MTTWTRDLVSVPPNRHYVCGGVTVCRIGFYGRGTKVPDSLGRYRIIIVGQVFLEPRGGPRGFACHFARWFVMVDDSVLSWPV